MAYCPRCGREQRCGCDKCHICGVEVVERRVEPTQSWMRAEARAASSATRHANAGVGVGVKENTSPVPADARASGKARVAGALPAVLLILGCGILLVTLIEAINTATNFPAVGTSVSLADALRRLGYYMGSLLYAASVRTITGFALVSLGLLVEPGRPFEDIRLARKVKRAVGLVSFVVALLCLICALLVVLPVGSTSFLIRNLLPAKWASVLTLVAMGAALLAAGYLLMARPAEPGPASRSRGDTGGRVPQGIYTVELANGGGGADESVGGVRRREHEGDPSGHNGQERDYPSPVAE